MIPLSHVVGSRNQAALLVSVNVCVAETQHSSSIIEIRYSHFILSMFYSSLQFIVVNISVYAIACRISLLHIFKGDYIVTLANTTTICRYINLFLWITWCVFIFSLKLRVVLNNSQWIREDRWDKVFIRRFERIG